MINHMIQKAGAIISKKNQASGVVCDACTGGLVFSWHMENSNITLGDPCGCSLLGDLIGTQVGSGTLTDSDKSDGTFALSTNSGWGYYVFGSNSNFPNAEGTIWLDFQITAYSQYNQETIFFANGGDTNYIKIFLHGITSEVDVKILHEGADDQNLLASNTNIDPADNKWWRIKYQWKVSEVGGGHKADIWELDSSDPRETTGSPSTIGPDDTLTEFDETIFTVTIGNNLGAAASSILLDNIKIYNTSDL